VPQLKNSAGVGLLEGCRDVRERAEVPASGVGRVHTAGECQGTAAPSQPPRLSCGYRAFSNDGSKEC